MTFTVRSISRTADGREIIRPVSFTQPQLIVGRDAACDIHLPDLALNLRHAVIQELTPNRIEIAATAGLPFDVDGRSTERADIDVSRGANVRMGSHMLTIGRGDKADEIVISVERVGALSEASEEKDEVRSFSLASAAPGKRASAWVLALLVMAAFLIWPIIAFSSNKDAAPETAEGRAVGFHADEMWSSGKLSQVHANLENNCKACHQKPGVAVRDEACAACHTKIHDHADPARLLAAKVTPGTAGQTERTFQAAFSIPEGRCVECHTEHEGAKAMPVTQQRFCSECHSGLSERLTDTKILDASDFSTTMHPEFRPAVMTNPGARPVVQRISLGARPLEDNGIKFPHDVHLAATGGIARMTQTFNGQYGFGRKLECKNCHVPDPSGARFEPITMEKNCQMCHSLAFDRVDGTIRTLKHGDPAQVVADIRAFYRSTAPAGANLSGMRRRPGDSAIERASASFQYAAGVRGGKAENAVRAAFSQGGVCFDCHSVTQPSYPGASNWGIVPVNLPSRYMMKGWFDHKAHETETCESCHAAPTSKAATDVLLPKLESCTKCHGGQDAQKAVPSSCAMCHDYHMDDSAPLMVRSMRIRGDRVDRVKTPAAAPKGG